MPYSRKGRKKSFPVFDCDSHIVEPPALWAYIPHGQQEFAKAHFFINQGHVSVLNGRISFTNPLTHHFPAERWHPGLEKKFIGSISPSSPDWDEKIGRSAIARDPNARLRCMDACGIDQVMVFPSSFVFLPRLKNPEAARLVCGAYNDWAYDYCSANPRRLFPCGVLPVQSVEYAIEELRRVAKRGFKAAAVRPVFVNDMYPTFPEFDPLWREFEDLGLALAMHTFIPAGEPLTEKLGEQIASRGTAGVFRVFPSETMVYTPAQFVPNILQAMGSIQPGGEALSFILEAEVWTTVVLLSGWLEKFPRLRAAVLEANASWLPLVLEKAETYLDLAIHVREAANPPLKISDPKEVFFRQCFIGFEADEDPVFRMWDLYEDIGLWASDMPHHDAADAWEAMDHMTKWGVPATAQEKLLGGNARRLYGIEPYLCVTEAPEEYQTEKISRLIP